MANPLLLDRNDTETLLGLSLWNFLLHPFKYILQSCMNENKFSCCENQNNIFRCSSGCVFLGLEVLPLIESKLSLRFSFVLPYGVACTSRAKIEVLAMTLKENTSIFIIFHARESFPGNEDHSPFPRVTPRVLVWLNADFPSYSFSISLYQCITIPSLLLDAFTHL